MTTISTVSQWDGTTASNNTNLNDIPLDGGITVASQLDDIVREMMRQIKAAGFITSTTSVFTDSTFVLQDNLDATKQLQWQLAGITAGNTRIATPPDADFTIAALNLAAQIVTGGARVTSYDLGTVSSGTTTLDPGNRPLQHMTNNGAFTLAPGSNTGSIILDVTNGASAGAVTTSGFTKVVGAFTTTNANKFRCTVVIGNAGSLLSIQAMQ